MATVPRSTPSTGIRTDPYRRAHVPPMNSAARSGLRDAATDQHGHVVVPADVRIGGEQDLLEVLPRVVAAGQATLEVEPDVVLGAVGDLEHARTPATSPGLNAFSQMPSAMEIVQERDRFVGVGDPSGDSDTADRCAGLAGPLHQSIPPQVQVPQVGVEVQGVEDDLVARGQSIGQLDEPFGEDRGADLAATGQFGHVPRVGGRGDDARRRRSSESCLPERQRIAQCAQCGVCVGDGRRPRPRWDGTRTSPRGAGDGPIALASWPAAGGIVNGDDEHTAATKDPPADGRGDGGWPDVDEHLTGAEASGDACPPTAPGAQPWTKIDPLGEVASRVHRAVTGIEQRGRQVTVEGQTVGAEPVDSTLASASISGWW